MYEVYANSGVPWEEGMCPTRTLVRRFDDFFLPQFLVRPTELYHGRRNQALASFASHV